MQGELRSDPSPDRVGSCKCDGQGTSKAAHQCSTINVRVKTCADLINKGADVNTFGGSIPTLGPCEDHRPTYQTQCEPGSRRAPGSQ